MALDLDTFKRVHAKKVTGNKNAKPKKKYDFSVDVGSVFSTILSKENLYVHVNKEAPTAYFDMNNRSIHVPDWNVEKETFQFLLTHELAHAMFTDKDKWLKAIKDRPMEEQQIYQMILNVVEDCRIDKLIQQKYPGVTPYYIKGMTDIILNCDFFQPEKGKTMEETLKNRSFVDKINVFFKTKCIGNVYDIKFDDKEEMPYIDRINDLRTFDEVKKIADELFEKFKKDNKDMFINMKMLVYQIVEGAKKKGQQSGDSAGKKLRIKGTGQPGRGGNGSGQDEGEGEAIDIDPNSPLGKALKKLVSSNPQGSVENGSESSAAQKGNLNSDSDSKGLTTTDYKPPHGLTNTTLILKDPTANVLKDTIIDVSTLRIQAQSSRYTVDRGATNWMASIFERKQDALDIQRTRVVKTGILDMKALHRSRYDEDIFLAQEITPDNKNHGFIFVVDCSGSMGSVFSDVIQYAHKMVLFCERLRVPFSVYGFSDHLGRTEIVKNTHVGNSGSKFGLIHMFDSRFSPKKNLNNCVKLMNYTDLGGTPLSTAINFVKKIGEDFKNLHKVDVLNVIFLTDGGCTNYNVYDNIVDDKTRIMKNLQTNIVGSQDNTNALYRILRERLHCNVFNFFIQDGSTKNTVKENHGGTNATYFINKRTFSDRNAENNVFINKIISAMAKLQKENA